jgi:hypothetical protein
MPPTLGLYLTLKVLPQERMALYMEGFLIWRMPYTKGTSSSSSEIAN